jgi:hypothetical protein
LRGEGGNSSTVSAGVLRGEAKDGVLGCDVRSEFDVLAELFLGGAQMG